MSRRSRVRVGACVVAAFVAAPITAGASAASQQQAAHGQPATAHYATTVLENKPALYWRLGEAGGRVADDESMYGREGAYHGSPIYGVPGAIGHDPNTQVDVNNGATEDWVGWNTGSHGYRGMFSFEAWVTPSANSGEQNFVSTRWSSQNFTFDAKLSDTDAHGIRVDVGNGTTWYVTKTLGFGWHKGETYHIVVIASAQRVTVYVNGLPLGYASYGCGSSCQLPLLYSQHEQFQIGRNSDYDEAFHGRIDEVALYQHRLSASQVAAHYRAGL